MTDIRKNLSNAIGWRTKRKIVVIESDDWGSVRTRSKKDFDEMMKKGLELNLSNFTRFDALESNSDLENLFDALHKYKDSTGRPAVFTPMCIMANPDFDKIKESYFENYYYEPFTETCKKYPNHNNVQLLWKMGISERLFVPQLHGREHLNVSKWMSALQIRNEGLCIAFNHQSIGSSWYRKKRLPEYLAAFDPEREEDIVPYYEIIKTAGELFNSICGYEPSCFIASNSSEPKSLESSLKKIGIKYLTRYKIQKYPLGNGKYKTEFNWLGKKNELGQFYLTRNCGFEPSDPQHKDWVSICMSEIRNAFYWKKPAIISSHRVNYIGQINPGNASTGLKNLETLLSSIIKSWPDVEFLTSDELGRIIAKD